MDSLFQIPTEELIKGGLIFLRITGIFFFLPIFGDYPTPNRVRILLAAAMTVGFYGLVPLPDTVAVTTDVILTGWLIFKELLIGLTLGFIARMAFAGVLMAANLVGYQMGFGTASLMMPGADQQMDGFSAFHRVLVILIFLSLDMHHLFVDAIAQSFTIIQLGGVLPQLGLGELLIGLSASIFVISMQLAAPVLVALLFTMAALGLIARTVPQMNVFTLSFPVSFFVGLAVYMATFPFFPEWMREHFLGTHTNMLTALTGLSR